jgi:hypothetical protein
VDWGFVAKHFGRAYQNKGGKIVLNFEADEFSASPNPEFPIRVISKNKVLKNLFVK